MQAFAWVLSHVSADDIVLVIHAWTLHHLLGGDLKLTIRVGKLNVSVSKTKPAKRAR